MVKETTEIEKKISEAYEMWMVAISDMLKAIAIQMDIPFDQIQDRSLIKHLDNNVKEHYFDHKLVLTSRIIAEKHKIKLEVNPAEEFLTKGG